MELFDAGRYLAAHELFEELWEATQGDSSDLYKGLLQAAVALHHHEQGNPVGAARLESGARRALARYLPLHSGLDLARFLGELDSFLGGEAGAARPVLRSSSASQPDRS